MLAENKRLSPNSHNLTIKVRKNLLNMHCLNRHIGASMVPPNEIILFSFHIDEVKRCVGK